MITLVARAAASPKRAALIALVGGMIALGAATASASVPGPLTLQESVVFGIDHQPPTGTFTAAALAGCYSGTFVDHLNQFNQGGHTLVVDRSYTCDGGAGAFTARMVLHLQPVDANGDQVVAGEWTILVTSGALAGAQGTGATSGVNSGCTPIGAQLPMCQTGVSTVTASIE